jgi:serine/threonine protein phosphatase 1
MLDRLAFAQTDQLFVLGDVVDRGPDSKGVIDLIWKMQREGYQVLCLRGNHEQMILNDLESGGLSHFYSDAAMLRSFEAKNVTEVPAQYIKWIDELPYFLEAEGYLLVHAGIDFSFENPLDNVYDMMWLRYWYDHINRDWLADRIVLHGHTPIEKPIIEDRLDELSRTPVLNIDNGCVYNTRGQGNLCAFDMTNRRLYFQENVDRS